MIKESDIITLLNNMISTGELTLGWEGGITDFNLCEYKVVDTKLADKDGVYRDFKSVFCSLEYKDEQNTPFVKNVYLSYSDVMGVVIKRRDDSINDILEE